MISQSNFPQITRITADYFLRKSALSAGNKYEQSEYKANLRLSAESAGNKKTSEARKKTLFLQNNNKPQTKVLCHTKSPR